MHHLTFPLHPAQWDVYTDQLLHVDSPHYNIGGYIKLKGPLDTEKFRLAVTAGPNFFDVFKIRFDVKQSEAVCYLLEDFDKMEIADQDFSNADSPEAEAIAWMKTRLNTAFVLDKKNLLFEQFLIRISSDEHWFFGKYHHLIIDGYGFIVWAQYLARKYQSLVTGDRLEFNYPAYQAEAIKAFNYYKSENYEQEGLYWKEKFAARPEKLLQKKSHFQNDAYNKSTTYTLSLAEEDRKLLEDIQLTTKSGLQQLTIAALLIHYGKVSDHAEFTFGIPVHKRGSRELRNTLGMFSGILPFKGTFQKENILLDFIKAIGQSQKKDYRHQHYLIGDLSRHLKLNSSEGYLCDIIINHELFNFNLNFGEDIKATIFRLTNEFEVNPLQLCWQDYGPQQPLQLHFHFRHDYFTKLEIELLAQRLLYILRQFPASLDSKIESIEIIPEEEKQLIDAFNDTTIEYETGKTIIDLFEEQVKQSPNAPAIVLGHSKLTYTELNERSNRLAHHLRSKGVKEETMVPVCVERSLEMVVGILGILKAGAAYVPIDPAYPEERIQYMLGDTKSTIVISSKQSRSKLSTDPRFDLIEIDSELHEINQQPTDNLQIAVDSHQLAYLIYTSGSTGKPKGVMIEHGNVYSFIRWCQQEFSSSDFEIVYAGTSLCFDLSVFEIFYPLSIGKPVRILENGLQIDQFLPFDKKVLTNSVPTVIQSLLKEGIDLSNISVMNMAGEPIPFQVQQGLDAEKMEIRNLYGPTEDTTYSTVYQLIKGRPVLIGKPISNSQAYILNKEVDLVPIGLTGEICLGGAGLARGYLNRPELTAEKFIGNPFKKQLSARLYKTGDLGRWLPDGNIEYQGRLDAQVKIRGFRIELGEIEAVLQQCELINEAVVLAPEDKEGHKRLVGYIVSKNKIHKEAIAAYLKNKLPEYMIPGLWVELDELPLTPNGKIDKKALPNPDISEFISKVYVAPRNVLEAQLEDIWKEVLEIERVGIFDNFFELGGHSLKAIQLITRLHKRLNIKTDLAKILANPTINELARVLALEETSAFSEIPKLPLQEHYELSHAQKRIFVFSYFKDGSTIYNAPGAYLIKGSLDVAAFKRAFHMVIERHENLRTVFIQVNNEPRQKILSSAESKFEIDEIDYRSKSNSGDLIKKWLEKDARKVFDLEKGPLFRAILFQTEEEKFILGFNIHHIISDGWSKGILIKEFLQLYQSLTTGIENKLPELPIQYKEYAAWHDASFASQQKYWNQLYEKNVPVLNFPTDFERPKVLSFDGAMVELSASETLTQTLRKTASQYGTTLNNLLFALYGLLIAKHSRQNDVVIGSLVSGRSHSDLENLVGVFINFLPIRLFPDPRLSLKDYINKSHQSLLHAYSNQDYPFDLMVENYIKKRDISRNPFFDTMVNFHTENNLQADIQLKQDLKSENGIEVTPLDLLKKDFFESVLDFKLDIENVSKGLALNLNYNASLFSKERMESLLSEFVDLLSTAVQEPDMKLSEYLKGDLEKDDMITNQLQESALLPPMLSVNICASFVAEPIQESLEYWSEELDLPIKVAFAPYNQLFQQLLDPESLLHKNTGINVLFIRVEDWLRDQKDRSSQEQIRLLNQTFAELIEAIEFIQKSTFIPFLTGIVPLGPSHSFTSEVADHIRNLNQKIQFFLGKLPRFYILDLEKIASLYKVEELLDDKADELGHVPFTQEYYAAIGTFIVRKIRAYKGPVYKVIALDCDNTLWKGVCGEVGALNVIIDENYDYLQEFLLEKYNQGFLLALCSKNNEEDVWEVFDNHTRMKIKREHIAAYQINWNPKPGNLVAISQELNVGLNSIIFIDDSEFEIEQTTLGCPEVLSLTLPENKPNNFSDFLNHIWALDYFQVTEEDEKRNTMYKAEKQRKEEQVKYSSLKDFLQSLNIKVNIRALEEKDLERAVQLTVRTNQFNLNGIRKSPEEIANSIKQQNTLNWIIEVKDRFGDYGIAGLLLARESQNTLVLETFLLSCRVLGRNVEEVILTELRNYCIVHRLDNVIALYQPTSKNKPFINFLLNSEWQLNSQTNTYSLFIKNSEHELLVE